MIKQDLVYKHEDCLGLDIGATSVKVVQLSPKKKLVKLVGYDMATIPENLIIEGIVSEPEKLAEIIRNMLKGGERGKFNAKKVVASIPDSNIFIRVLQIPKINEKDLKEAVFWEADQSIPMSISDLVIDWQILKGASESEEEKKGTNDVLLVAAPRSIVNSYVQLFQALNLRPEAIETSMTSMMRSLISDKDEDQVSIVMDMGGKSSSLGLYDGTLRFSDTLDFGSKKFIETIAKELKMEKEKAEELQKKKGLNDEKVKSAVDPLLQNFKQEITKLIRYQNDRSKNKRKVKRIVLTGGLSSMPGLTEDIASETNLEVKVGNPWINITTYPLKSIPKQEAPAYAGAIGLSLRPIIEEKND